MEIEVGIFLSVAFVKNAFCSAGVDYAATFTFSTGVVRVRVWTILFYLLAVIDGKLAGIGGIEWRDWVFDGFSGSSMAAVSDVSSRIWRGIVFASR